MRKSIKFIVLLLSLLCFFSANQSIAGNLAGSIHSVFLKNDGTVWAWGSNNYGQLGDGTTAERHTPVSGLTGVTEISVGSGSVHSLALKSDSTVWAWGYNYYGQLGDGTIIERHTPVPVSGLTDVITIAAGSHHSLAVKSDGTVWAWGSNQFGKLGNGTIIDSSTPVQVSDLTGVTAVAADLFHSLALKSDGTVWAWGSNFGRLGDGTTTERHTPVQVIGLTAVTAIAVGMNHSLALKSDGTVWAWGSNANGQLGDGTTTQSLTPVQVIGLTTDVIAIAAGSYHSLALKSDGTVWAWGSNTNGQLGDNTIIERHTPVQVSNLTGVTAIAGGYYHSLASKSDGTVWAWGSNASGQLGDGTITESHTPVQVSGFQSIYVGFNNALDFDGSNDTITAPQSAAFAMQTFTIEAWIKLDPTASGNQSIATYGKGEFISGGTTATESVAFTYRTDLGGGQFRLRLMNSGGTSFIDLLPAYPVASVSGTWVHAAATWDGTTATIFINGKSIGSQTAVDIINYSSDVDTKLRIGNWFGINDRWFKGNMDEVRIWNDVRTTDEIRSNKYKELAGSEANLVAYYKFNEMDVTTPGQAVDSSGYGHDGTYESSMTDADCVTSGAFSGPRNALDLDGTDDAVDCGPQASLQITGDVSVECWANYDAIDDTDAFISQGTSIDAGVSDPYNMLYVLRIFSNKAIGLFWEYGDGINVDIRSSATANVNSDEWHHYAAVRDVSAMEVTFYIDGIQLGDAISYSNNPDGGSLGTFTIGAEYQIFTTPLGYQKYFDGKIDEVRVWNAARTEIQIRDTICKTLAGDEDNLVAYYRFDQENTAGQTTLYDLTANGNNGTLTNMDPLTAWVASSAFNTWIGSEGTDWATGGNWSRYAAPTTTDNVGIIDYTGGNAPTVTAAANAGNIVIATDADFTVSGNNTLSVAGNWMNNGNFTANTSTVDFNGADQYICGDTAFYDLTKNVTTAAALTFENGAANKTIVTNTLDLQGAAGQLLSLRSDADGSQWEIDPQGTRTVNYLDVRDAKNVNASDINAFGTNSTDSGNNTAWVFVDSIPPVCQSINVIGTPAANAASVSFTTTFSEVVTGVDSTDFALTESGVAGSSVSAVSPNFGSALELNGTDQYVNAGTDVSLNFTKNFTISAWIKPTATDGQYGLVGKLTDDSDKQYQLDVRNGKLLFQYEKSGNNWELEAGVITADVWQHVAATIAGDLTVRLYVNGLLQGTDVAPAETTAANQPLNIGRYAGSYNTNYFGGEIDEIRMWNSMQTQAQIQADMNRPLQGNESGLEAYWRMDALEDLGINTDGTDDVQDLTANGNDGDTQNSPGLVSSSAPATSSDTWAVTVNTGNGDGTIRLDVDDNDSIIDFASNPLGGTGAGNGDFKGGQVYDFDNTAPGLTSFSRQSPATNLTNADSLIFLATFSEDVMNVDTADFAVDGTTTAVVTNVTPQSATTYEVTVSGGDLAVFTGAVGIDLSGGQNITDTLGNVLPAGEPATDETFYIGSPGNWSDDFNNDASRNWETTDTGENSTVEEINDRLELFTESSGGAAHVSAFVNDTDVTDGIITARVQEITTGDSYNACLMLRYNASGADSGYLFGVTEAGTAYFAKRTNGTTTTLKEKTGVAITLNDMDCRLKFAVIGDKLFGKIWDEGDTEPCQWLIETSDTDFSSGDPGVGISVSGVGTARAAFDDVSVTTDISNFYQSSGACGGSTILAGGSAAATAGDSSITVYSNAVQSHAVGITEVSVTPDNPDRGMFTGNLIDKSLDISCSLNNGDFTAVVKLHYTDVEIMGINEMDLRLYYYDENTEAWLLAVDGNTAGSSTWQGNSAPTTTLGDHGVDADNNIVWAVVDHFTDFGAGGIGTGGWVLQDSPASGSVSTMLQGDSSQTEDSVAVAASATLTWVAGAPATSDTIFSDPFGGQLMFSVGASGTTYTVQVGSWSGGTFTSGDTATLTLDGSQLYDMDALNIFNDAVGEPESFTVSAGEYIAMQITNNTGTAHTLLTGGLRSWLNATGSNNPYPTVIELASFNAADASSGMKLTWHTESEVDNAGFHIWRCTTLEGQYECITTELIPAEGSDTVAVTYTYTDTTATSGQLYYYKLEDISDTDEHTLHGPIAVNQPGDINGDNTVDLADTICALQVMAGISTGPLNPASFVTGGSRVGLADALFPLKVVSGLRSPEEQ